MNPINFNHNKTNEPIILFDIQIIGGVSHFYVIRKDKIYIMQTIEMQQFKFKTIRALTFYHPYNFKSEVKK